MHQETLAVIWVDTEDFVTPQSDDAALRVANTFRAHGIKVNFKLVGEEVRALVRRNRRDTLEAISHHDVGYHSNYHSVHPTMSEYVGDMGWDAGVNEWDKRERQGYIDLKKTIGRDPVCYGHPGSSWMPQVYPVLKKWGVPVYLDDMETISAKNEKPFYMCNTLNLQGFGTNVLCLDGPPSSADLPEDHLSGLPQRFNGILQKFVNREDTPIIGMYCHPNSYATEEFWDKVNFNRGKNPEGFKSVREPGAMRPAKLKAQERIDREFKSLEAFLDLAKATPHLHFITASDALKIYHDRALEREFSKKDLGELCEKSLQSINYQMVGEGVSVNPAEIYSMVLHSLVLFSKEGKLPESVTCFHPMGPKEEFDNNAQAGPLDTKEFLKACSHEDSMMRKTGYMSSHISIGHARLSPADMFVTCCALYLDLAKGRNPNQINPSRGSFEVGNMISDKGALADWSYYFLPENFKAPMQTRLARLQAWTLKPALADASVIQQLYDN